MNRLFSLPVRLQLFFIVSLLAVFAAGTILYSGVRLKNELITDAMQETQSIAAVIAVQHQSLVSSTEQLLSVLSQAPDLRRRNIPKLKAMLGEIIKLNPQYSTIFITDLKGVIWVSALPLKSLKITDIESFDRAVRSGNFSSGQYKMGQHSGKQVLSLYFPYKDGRGKTAGVIILGIDLNYHRRILSNFKLPPFSSYLLLDRKGVILTGGANNEFAGRPYEAGALARMKRGPETDTFISTGVDGKERFISYRKLSLAGEQTPYMYVRAGIPVVPVLAEANKALIRNLGIFMTSLLVVLYLVWIIGKRSIADRVSLLEKSSLRLADGDLSVRVGDFVPGGELGNLARTFDHMAAQLSIREQDLKESRATLRQILDTLPQSIFWKDRESVYLGCNEVFARAVGLDDPEKIRGKTDFDMPWPREEAETHRADDREVISGNLPKRHIIEPFERPDGVKRWIDTIRVPLVDGNGAVFGILGVYEDITESRLAEEALRRSDEFIRDILDSVDEGFIVIDRDYRILTVNRAYCSQVGLPCEEIIGKNCFEISHRAFRPCHEQGEDCAVRRVFETGEPHTALHHHPDPEGKTLYVETKAFPMRDKSGQVVSTIETITNITSRHLLEEERLKRQKLEAIGTLAGGIAHDFRNLLQGVFGFMSMAKIGMDRQGDSFEMLEQAEQALQMSLNLTTQLLTFSKGGSPAKKRLHLPPVIESSARFALSGSRSNYRFRHDHDLWPVEADAGQISQVIQNIVLNASEAMPDGGTVEILARNLDTRLEARPSLSEGVRFVSILIQDSGTGIPEQYLSRIFDPYFTTKQKGSGLGLATSYSIIKNHGGTIDVKSQEGSGSAFFIYLPATEITETPSDLAPVSVPGRKGKILVMDDEEIVRQVATKMIESLGHEVGCALDGEAAIEQFAKARQAGSPFDIVILDLTVKGGMGGEQAAVKLREIDPDVKLVVSSGYSDSSVLSDYRSHGFVGSLSKPYVIEDLSACLNYLLS